MYQRFLIIFILLNNFFLLNKRCFHNCSVNKYINCSREIIPINNTCNSCLAINNSYDNKKRFIITMAPLHKNYGDEAILLATKQFLEDYFPDIKQIVIQVKQFLNNLDLIKYVVNDDDIIIINGGGYFGLYDRIIKEQVTIVKNFPNNQIIFFPCSIFDNPKKKEKYTPFLNVFHHHPNLTFFIRDKISFAASKRLFPQSSIYKVPDIVTRLNLDFLNDISNNRNGILLILRKDELLLNEENHKFIKKISRKYFNNNEIQNLDSDKFEIPEGSNRLNETLNFIKLIKSKELVITDRLHGMIFSIITGTPNIVFGNNYHKVESGYNSWFNNIPYSFFIKKEEIEYKLEQTMVKIINSNNNNKYENEMFQKYYILMRDIIYSKIYN